jgi:hypothetical protein
VWDVGQRRRMGEMGRMGKMEKIKKHPTPA